MRQRTPGPSQTHSLRRTHKQKVLVVAATRQVAERALVAVARLVAPRSLVVLTLALVLK